MVKIRRIAFMNHPVLGNIELDFCKNNKAVDTIILAGENGTGKTIILEYIYQICNKHNNIMPNLKELEIEEDGKIQILRFSKQDQYNQYFTDTNGTESLWGLLNRAYIPNAILSGTEINFNNKGIDKITSFDLDMNSESSKTDINMANHIEQLIVDIYNADNATIGDEWRKKGKVEEGEKNLKMNRLIGAFDNIFDDIKFDSIKNENNQKKIYFRKSNALIPIESLSSGEKQVIYRGCFLLKDREALKGAFVLIDEPEISMHPRWQKKIMNYYKNIFTDDGGDQTSQIFAVTHSPFIIHNDDRINDKVLVLYRDEKGIVRVSEKPEYYKADTSEAVKDSFLIDDFKKEDSYVFVEGKTDEQYFYKAVEVFDIDIPFTIKSVGRVDENGQEHNSGKDGIKRIYHFLCRLNSIGTCVCLADNDANYETKRDNNIIITTMPKYNSAQNISKGIENALVLEGINIEEYHDIKKIDNGYGMEKTIPELKKQKLCDHIMSLDISKQREILTNLKDIIETIKREYF